MTKEELLLRIKGININIQSLRASLNELYLNTNSSMNESDLKKEAEYLKEISNLKKEKDNLLTLEQDLVESIVLDDKNAKEEINTKEDEKVESNNNKISKYIRVLYGSALSISLIALLTCTIQCSKKNKSNVVSPTSTPISKSIKIVLPTETPEPTPEILFEDVTNEEELIERANLIYNIDLAPILNDLENSKIGDYITEEMLVDMIRVSLGELPLYNEYGPNTVGEAIQARTDVFGNLGSTPELDKLYPVHYEYLAPNNSELAEYMSSYDEIYNSIAESRNSKDVTSTIESIKSLAIKQYNEFVLGGMYGEYNPYNFEYKYRGLALGASVERYASYVLEFIDSNKLTICVPVCIDYETGEIREVNVVDIYEAILLGKSKNGKINMSYFGEDQVIKISKVFYKELISELDYKNELVLKRGK